jgi:hypothetical protein
MSAVAVARRPREAILSMVFMGFLRGMLWMSGESGSEELVGLRNT